ncbi:MAG: hypothetical protein L6Q37_11050 [Bdellovibrionaceae bacterium]|nr:hypothetical protein [Pseudobdellovibrionaceae bacterium]NUM59291.1 hypothetical protein [Pseudobdellovibrionaceae bacterium]
MKKLILVFGLLTSVSLFAVPSHGPSISNGTQGFEFVRCQGSLEISKSQNVNAVVSVAAYLNKGILAKVTLVNNPSKPLFYAVEASNDLRGTIYKDAFGKISILVPNMQNHQLPSGVYNAVLSLPEVSKHSALLVCSK